MNILPLQPRDDEHGDPPEWRPPDEPGPPDPDLEPDAEPPPNPAAAYLAAVEAPDYQRMLDDLPAVTGRSREVDVLRYCADARDAEHARLFCISLRLAVAHDPALVRDVLGAAYDLRAVEEMLRRVQATAQESLERAVQARVTQEEVRKRADALRREIDELEVDLRALRGRTAAAVAAAETDGAARPDLFKRG